MRGDKRNQIMTDCSVDQLLIYHGNKKNLATEDTEDTEFFFLCDLCGKKRRLQ
jgi:hypothetical protein